jgi:hypothetical protein
MAAADVEQVDGTMLLNDINRADAGEVEGQRRMGVSADVGHCFGSYCSSSCNYWGGESESKSMGMCLPSAYGGLSSLPWAPFGGYADNRDTGVGHIPSMALYRRNSFSCNDLQSLNTDEERRAALERGLEPRISPTRSEVEGYSLERAGSSDEFFGGSIGGRGAAGAQTVSPSGLLNFGGFRRLSHRTAGLTGLKLHPASQAAEDAFAAAAALDQDDPDRPLRVLFCCHGSRGDVQPLVALALGMKERGGYEVAFWTVKPVDEFVKRQGIPCYVHDLDTDVLMRRTQTKVTQGAAERLGKALGFFKAVAEVMLEPDIAPKIDAIPDAVLRAHIAYKPDLTITSHCMPAISCAEYLHIPVVYIALQPMYPTKHFPPWAFRSTNFDRGLQWMNKPLGQLFMSIYENQTYLKGVKKCRQLANLPLRRFSDGTPV